MQFSTNISVDDCKSRLLKAVNTGRWSYWLSEPPTRPEIYGAIQDNTFQLRIRTYRNRTGIKVFSGKLVNSEEKTFIQGQFSIDTVHYVALIFSICFLISWFSMMFCFLVAITFFSNGAVGMLIYSACGVVLVVALIIVSVKAYRWYVRGLERKIVEFLKNTLEAHETV